MAILRLRRVSPEQKKRIERFDMPSLARGEREQTQLETSNKPLTPDLVLRPYVPASKNCVVYFDESRLSNSSVVLHVFESMLKPGAQRKGRLKISNLDEFDTLVQTIEFRLHGAEHDICQFRFSPNRLPLTAKGNKRCFEIKGLVRFELGTGDLLLQGHDDLTPPTRAIQKKIAA